jgi:hypothetical protein
MVDSTRRPAPSAHVWAHLGYKIAKGELRRGIKLPCYIADYPPEFQRTYCLAYGYDTSGKPL